MNSKGLFEPTPQQLLVDANMWEQRAEEHIRAADFCKAQAERFIGRIAVPDDFKPELTLIISPKSE